VLLLDLAVLDATAKVLGVAVLMLVLLLLTVLLEVSSFLEQEFKLKNPKKSETITINIFRILHSINNKQKLTDLKIRNTTYRINNGNVQMHNSCDTKKDRTFSKKQESTE